MEPNSPAENEQKEEATVSPRQWMFVGTMSASLKRSLLLAGGTRNGCEESTSALPSGETLLFLDPLKPVACDGGKFLFQEVGQWPPKFWSFRKGSEGMEPATQDLINRVVDRALYHNECPSCGQELSIRSSSGGFFVCSDGSNCITKIKRNFSPPIGEPLWRILHRETNWENLASSSTELMATTQQILDLTREDIQYLRYQFLPMLPEQNVKMWVKFLVKRQMCWGPGVRRRLFLKKKNLIMSKFQREFGGTPAGVPGSSGCSSSPEVSSAEEGETTEEDETATKEKDLEED